MIPIRESFVTDDKGKRTAVLIDIRDYERLKEYMEDLEDAGDLIRARETGGDSMSLEEWKKELTAQGRL